MRPPEPLEASGEPNVEAINKGSVDLSAEPVVTGIADAAWRNHVVLPPRPEAAGDHVLLTGKGAIDAEAEEESSIRSLDMDRAAAGG